MLPGPLRVEVDVADATGTDYVTAAIHEGITSEASIHRLLLFARDEGDATAPMAWLYAEGGRYVGKAELLGDELILEVYP